MQIRNIKYDLIIYLVFWAIYAPSALTIWHHNRGSLLELSIVLLAGLGVILGILLYTDKLPKRKTNLELPPENPEFAGFRRLFSQNKLVEVVHYE